MRVRRILRTRGCTCGNGGTFHLGGGASDSGAPDAGAVWFAVVDAGSDAGAPVRYEMCGNHLDDDGDGQIDESLTRGCASTCGVGTETCNAGGWGGCTARTPTTEICGNGVDENCDGVDDRCI